MSAGAIGRVEHPVVGTLRDAVGAVQDKRGRVAVRTGAAARRATRRRTAWGAAPTLRTASSDGEGAFLPLDGVRVLDLTTAWAGPSATRALGALGADVLKIEACTWYDAWRGPATPPPPGVGNYADNDPGTKPHERAPLFGTANRNKRGIALDLTKPEGRDVFCELVAKSDVVLSNFSARVLPNLGLGYQQLCAIKRGHHPAEHAGVRMHRSIRACRCLREHDGGNDGSVVALRVRRRAAADHA